MRLIVVWIVAVRAHVLSSEHVKKCVHLKPCRPIQGHISIFDETAGNGRDVMRSADLTERSDGTLQVVTTYEFVVPRRHEIGIARRMLRAVTRIWITRDRHANKSWRIQQQVWCIGLDMPKKMLL